MLHVKEWQVQGRTRAIALCIAVPPTVPASSIDTSFSSSVSVATATAAAAAAAAEVNGGVSSVGTETPGAGGGAADDDTAGV